MKAILIDPALKEVKEIDINGDLHSMYGAMECSTICAPIEYENYDTLFADDESLFNEDNIKGGFMYKDWAYPIIGKALIMGCNSDTGDSIDVKGSVEDYLEGIIWVSEEAAKIHAEKALNTPPQIFTF